VVHQLKPPVLPVDTYSMPDCAALPILARGSGLRSNINLLTRRHFNSKQMVAHGFQFRCVTLQPVNPKLKDNSKKSWEEGCTISEENA
jgi:hypothetical protein